MLRNRVSLVLFLVPLAPVQLAEFLLEVKRFLQFRKLIKEDVHPLPLLVAPFVGYLNGEYLQCGLKKRAPF